MDHAGHFIHKKADTGRGYTAKGRNFSCPVTLYFSSDLSPALSFIPHWRRITPSIGNRREKSEYLLSFFVFSFLLSRSPNLCCFLGRSLAMSLSLSIWRQYSFLKWHLALVQINPFNCIKPLIGRNNSVSQFALSKCWKILLIQSCLKIFKLYFILTVCSQDPLKKKPSLPEIKNPALTSLNLPYL